MGGICDNQVFTELLTILPNCSVGVIVAVDKYVLAVFTFLVFMTFYALR